MWEPSNVCLVALQDLQKSHRQLEDANQKLHEVVAANHHLETAYSKLEASKVQLEEQLAGCGDTNSTKVW